MTVSKMLKICRMKYRTSTISQLLKYLLTFVLGFCCHLFLNSNTDELRHCEAKLQNISKCPGFSERYKPKTKFEVIRYDYFDQLFLYSNIEDDTKIGLLGYHKKDIQQRLAEALQDITQSGHFSHRVKLKSFRNGYRRVEPNWGTEYILDLDIQINEEIKKWRVQIVQPNCELEVNSFVVKSDESSETVNVIVPIDGPGERFRKFLLSFSSTFLAIKEKVSLIVVTSEFQNETDVNQMKSLLQNLMNIYPEAEIKLVLMKNNFSRGVALDIGARTLDRDSLMFFVDADLLIARDFLQRCRLNTQKNKRVFYPIIFSQYDPNIVKKYSPKGKVKSIQDINKFTGHWVHYGYGMVCLYNDDYQNAGGYDLNISGWGGEDVDLYQKHVHSSLEIFRAMDPGLIHRFHEKYCDPGTPQWESCVGSQVNTYGSRMQLALKILSENKINSTILP